jgi:hypothetical protein
MHVVKKSVAAKLTATTSRDSNHSHGHNWTGSDQGHCHGHGRGRYHSSPFSLSSPSYVGYLASQDQRQPLPPSIPYPAHFPQLFCDAEAAAAAAYASLFNQ